MKTNCYHGRDSKDAKLFGGMLHASTYDEAAQRACAGLEVKITTSGRAHFVDKEGREVRLYISVHPEHTAKGETALKAYRKERYNEWLAKDRVRQFAEYDEDSEETKKSEDS